MTDLAERIAALPEWPDITNPRYISMYCHAWDKARLYANRARLALVSELAQAGDVRLVRHTDDCLNDDPLWCSCGRDALLKAMEVPRG